MTGLFSFNTPCLRAKQFVAFKNQNGVPGFSFPYSTRYLTVDITQNSHFINDAGTSFQDSTNTYHTDFDRITGLVTVNTPNVRPGTNFSWIAQFDFPYDAPIDDTWTVSDDQYIHKVTETLAPAGGTETGVFKITTTTVQLSNPYTLAMLDADATAMIKTLIATDTPWNTVVTAFANEHQNDPDFNPGALIGNLLPSNAGFDPFNGATPSPLKAVAWNIWAPAVVSPNEWFGNNYIKLVSIVAMAGNYCLKTFQIEPGPVQLSETCISGSGSCANYFEVDPPAPIPNQNSYMLLVPNCQCGA